MKKTVIILSIAISVLSICASLVGLYSDQVSTLTTFTTVNNVNIELYNVGIYFRDSLGIAAQGIASDFITLIIAVPVLLLSAIMYYKDSFKGKLLLTGITGYFLYTYMSYTFLWNYNYLFLVYVTLMSLSLYSFVIQLLGFDVSNIKNKFQETLPTKFIGIYQILIGLFVGLMWLGIVVSGLLSNEVPLMLEHYTTLVIQAMDLAFVVPFAILSGILIMKKKNYGYVFSSIVIIKGSMMLLAILTMIINQYRHDIEMSIIPVIAFSVFTVVSLYALYKLLVNVKTESLT